MQLEDILRDKSKKLALVIGNGVNRFNNNNGGNSWDEMLLNLWERHTEHTQQSVPNGISLTEFYDVLELNSELNTNSLQKEFCGLMSDWEYKSHHENITNWARNNKTPILTTNFENTLSSSLTDDLKHLNFRKFTDYYPWSSYYSDSVITNPSDEFAVWHINGLQKYTRSIRLGLTHYMGSAAKARKLLHNEKEESLFSGKDVNKWKGFQTWLHIVFNNDLVVFGLGLSSTEVFIRWLLIERAKYFKKFPERTRSAYYIYSGNDITAGQKLFLSSVGFEICKEASFGNIYVQPWKRS